MCAFDRPERHTLKIVTSSPRVKDFAALKATAGSMICVQDESAVPVGMPNSPVDVNIHHDYPLLRDSQFAIVLDGGSLLTGANQITFTMKNVNNEIVPMPESQTVITEDSKSKVFD